MLAEAFVDVLFTYSSTAEENNLHFQKIEKIIRNTLLLAVSTFMTVLSMPTVQSRPLETRNALHRQLIRFPSIKNVNWMISQIVVNMLGCGWGDMAKQVRTRGSNREMGLREGQKIV